MDFDWSSFEKKLQEEFVHVLERLNRNYRKIYTSRINPDLFGDIVVSAYGSDMRLQELANLQIPVARTIVIKPYDPNTIPDIVKALQKTHPEFSPSVQPDHIKITLNPPTEESRKRSVKEAKEYLEQCKAGVRNIRKDFMDTIKKSELPEDQEKKYIQQVEAEIKKMNGKLEEVFGLKEKELMTI